jgi:hypothetical protein
MGKERPPARVGLIMGRSTASVKHADGATDVRSRKAAPLLSEMEKQGRRVAPTNIKLQELFLVIVGVFVLIHA